MRRGLAAMLFFMALAVLPLAAQEAGPVHMPPQSPLFAGAYSFSDELGGFTILSASGSGTRADPIVLVQELNSASPVTMVIRSATTIRPFALFGDNANGILYMRVEIFNASGLPWLEFEFELQETLRQPSVYGDGLSFNQRKADNAIILSDRFSRFNDEFEPYDRLIYYDGFVDPLDTATFSFLITDFTPQPEFYLLQDPRIPAS